ncbi:membrane progestin receptor alpha-like [Mya arenaria]|uniref:membrane progestin receptor alpha-like n=1 Tax=Mya arenaria TaxID=6604 RepID=UPI0022E2E8A4|nr:membrane progestin receptor alpha-like [Mya arenaria]
MKHRHRTLAAEQVPKELRVPHVKSGYRLLNQPWMYYIESLVHIHNETLNVWTHLIGCVLLIIQMTVYFYIYASDNAVIRWTLLGHGTCCFITLFNSAVAHLLHSRSCYSNFMVFMYDYVGVVSWGFGTAILAMYGVSDKHMYEELEPAFLTIQLIWTYLTFIIICMSKLWFGHDLEISSRKKMIVVSIFIQALSNVIPWFPRYISCFNDVDCSLSSLNHITVVCVSFTLMTITFVLHQPEKSWPGKFDIYGQSHQIFHVIATVTQSLQFYALYIDYTHKVNSHCQPNLNKLGAHILLLNISCILTLIYFKPNVRKKLQDRKSKHD